MAMNHIPQEQWIQWIGWAIALGFIAGTIAIGFVSLLRWRWGNPVLTPEQYLGLKGVVTIPFNSSTTGKIRIFFDSHVVEKWAMTDQAQNFEIGEIAYVVDIVGNKLWVISEDEFSLDFS